MKTLRQIFEESGRSFDYDKRNFYYKTLCKLWDEDLFSFEVSRKGFHTVRKSDGFKFNLRVQIGSMSMRSFEKHDITPLTILTHISKILQVDSVKTHIKLKFSYAEGCYCGRCGGKGFIPQFKFNCNGICFECYGLGGSFKIKNVNI